MKLLDTNILIYAAQPEYADRLLPFVTDTENAVSSISKIETLGFHRITPEQINYFNNLFKVIKIIPIDDTVVQKAVQLRQNSKMSLGDSIIAATALITGATLITRNHADFSNIKGLEVINPID